MNNYHKNITLRTHMKTRHLNVDKQHKVNQRHIYELLIKAFRQEHLCNKLRPSHPTTFHFAAFSYASTIRSEFASTKHFQFEGLLIVQKEYCFLSAQSVISSFPGQHYSCSTIKKFTLASGSLGWIFSVIYQSRLFSF